MSYVLQNQQKQDQDVKQVEHMPVQSRLMCVQNISDISLLQGKAFHNNTIV